MEVVAGLFSFALNFCFTLLTQRRIDQEEAELRQGIAGLEQEIEQQLEQQIEQELEQQLQQQLEQQLAQDLAFQIESELQEELEEGDFLEDEEEGDTETEDIATYEEGDSFFVAEHVSRKENFLHFFFNVPPE